jgi:hypothetical protein
MIHMCDYYYFSLALTAVQYCCGSITTTALCHFFVIIIINYALSEQFHTHTHIHTVEGKRYR